MSDLKTKLIEKNFYLFLFFALIFTVIIYLFEVITLFFVAFIIVYLTNPIKILLDKYINKTFTDTYLDDDNFNIRLGGKFLLFSPQKNDALWTSIRTSVGRNESSNQGYIFSELILLSKIAFSIIDLASIFVCSY